MASTTDTVILFDIDGTLITSGGAGRGAILRALERFTGVSDVTLDFSFAGMTDRGISRQALTSLGHTPDDAAIDAFLEVYLPILQETVRDARQYGVHPGVVDTLDALGRLPHLAIGLGTGNVEAGARIKLARVGLNPYFAFGGYGCDGEQRSALIGAGIKRGADALGLPSDAVRALIIGDTPNDVAAAHANGARCLGVATGGASFEALVESGADACVKSLASPGAREALWGLLDL